MADRFARECDECLRRSGADVVHVVGQDAGAALFIGRAHAAGIPTLFQELGGGPRPPVLPGLPSALRLCSEVAALSPRIAERAGGLLDFHGPVTVLPIITEPPDHTIAARPPRSRVTFGFAGRIAAPKGALMMVDALARARATVPGITLRVAGAGPQERPLRARARQHGISDACERTATYAGPAERTAFMRDLDVLLLPSDTEGTPNCIVEAMAHGVPVISTEIGGIPDVVSPEVGILVPPGDVDALSRAMTWLADDTLQRARMGLAAVERYQRLFAPASVMPLLLETYHRVAGGSARPGVASTHDWAPCGEGR
jgi:glycosyltransferase involved in cell wall biosynthesis